MNQEDIKDKLNSAIEKGEVKILLEASDKDALTIDIKANEDGPYRTPVNRSFYMQNEKRCKFKDLL